MIKSGIDKNCNTREIVKISDKIGHKYFGQPVYNIENYVTRIEENPIVLAGNDIATPIIINKKINTQQHTNADKVREMLNIPSTSNNVLFDNQILTNHTKKQTDERTAKSVRFDTRSIMSDKPNTASKRVENSEMDNKSKSNNTVQQNTKRTKYIPVILRRGANAR